MLKVLIAFLLSGILFICIYAYPIANVKSPNYFTPINSQHFSCGDHRFYFAGVNSALNNLFTFNPSTGSTGDGVLIDKSRVGLYRLGAVLTLFIQDKRWAYLASHMTSILVTIYLLILLFSMAGVSTMTSSLFALIFFFFLEPFRMLLLNDFNSALYAFKELLFLGESTLFPQRINDNFRFLVLSHANILILLGLIATLKLLKHHFEKKIVLVAGALGVCLLYTYLPVILYVGFLLGLAIIDAAKNNLKNVKYVAIFMITLVVLLVSSGVLEDLLEIYSVVPKAIASAHFSNFEFFSLNNFLSTKELIGSTVFFTIISFVAIMRNLSCKKIVTFLAALLFIQTLVVFAGFGYVLNRFFIRGGLSVALIITLLFFWELFKTYKYAHKAKLVLQMSTIAILCFILNTLYANSVQLTKMSSYTLFGEKWEVYSYLSKQSEVKEVLSLNSEDIQLLSVLTPHNLTVAGAEFLRDSQTELNKIIYFSKKYQIKIPFSEYFKTYIEQRKSFACSPRNDPNAAEEFEGMHLLDQIVYYPFINEVGGVRFVKDGKITDEFLTYFDTLSGANTFTTPDYIVLTTRQFDNSDQKELLKDYVLILKNTKRVLLQRI